MAARKVYPPRLLLEPTSTEALRVALERLRANGLSRSEAAAELLRRNFYDLLDSQTDTAGDGCHRLRIIKR